MEIVSINRNYFKCGLNVAICMFEHDLFLHYYNESHSIPLEEEEAEKESKDWIQLIVAQGDVPNAQMYVHEGALMFLNTKTEESFFASGHTIVCLAEDVTFIEPDSIGFSCL